MSSVCLYEDEVARRWWALPVGSLLPLSNGATYRLLFAGRPGGSAGPDVRDAVVGIAAGPQGRGGEKRVGDVEFHTRSSDWVTHRHQSDARYNHVMLHVVLICDDTAETLRQDGQVIPVCSLYDLVPEARPAVAETVWVCQQVMAQLSVEERGRLLRQAGLARFELKAHAFVEKLHGVGAAGVVDGMELAGAYDSCLIAALGEGLGYGRDRDFFRAAGLYLSGGMTVMGGPEPLGRGELPAPLDARRLRALRLLVQGWGEVGVWQTVRGLVLLPVRDGLGSCLQALREAFCGLGLSLGRADIVICNVVLPFAAAVALLEGDGLLAERAQALYEVHPGLCSNRVTRMMCAQLLLREEPRGACQQQGLHYIYQQTCREKRCEVCEVGRLHKSSLIFHKFAKTAPTQEDNYTFFA